MKTNRHARVLGADLGRPEDEPDLPSVDWSIPSTDRSRRSGHRAVVYYMRMDRLVKIGTTISLAGRIESIMPQGVLAVEYGAHALERERHKEFAEFHSHREWYWLRERLWDHVRMLRDRFAEQEDEDMDAWLARHGALTSSLLDPVF